MNSGSLEKPESESQYWNWRASEHKITTEQRLSSVIAEAMGVGAKTILFRSELLSFHIQIIHGCQLSIQAKSYFRFFTLGARQ